MEKVRDEKLRQDADTWLTASEVVSIRTELLAARAVVEVTRLARTHGHLCGLRGLTEKLDAYDALFTAPAPPADPTLGGIADEVLNELAWDGTEIAVGQNRATVIDALKSAVAADRARSKS